MTWSVTAQSAADADGLRGGGTTAWRSLGAGVLDGVPGGEAAVPGTPGDGAVVLRSPPAPKGRCLTATAPDRRRAPLTGHHLTVAGAEWEPSRPRADAGSAGRASGRGARLGRRLFPVAVISPPPLPS
ncbi:hypothetical protein [Streptomyces sp. TRM68416]|uniref:hypothetical protein n=1 Tax=Streptomyces sp. TRM68416 TaxID=2758412 RepID=UPI001661EA2C|nr:hypothetical protein [Streptomyces sp. TRM68416]MBD0838252.1 hypothetical protein [Streptomyces sp. TRM68416]